MRIGAPTLEVDDRIARWSVPVSGRDVPERLWFEIPADHAGLLTDLSDTALVGLLVPALERSEPLHLEGPVSPDLLHTLRMDVMRLVAMQIGLPDLIDVRASADARPRAALGTVATGFSCGVDSFWVVARHIGSDVSIGTRLTHLLSNNVGSSGRGVPGRALWIRRAGRVRRVADSLGLPLVTVDSNLADFHRTTFPRSHSLRNVAVALLLQAGIDRFLLAGTYEFPDIRIRQGGDSAHVEPMLVPLLSTGSLRAMSVGGSTGRVGRTREVAAFPASWTALDVCISSTPPPAGPVNCSRCWKCLRTLVTLDAVGELDRYAEVFDLSVYRAHRRTYVLSMTRRNVLEREILDHARESGHDLGLGPLGRSLRVLAERLPRRLRARAARLASTRPGPRGARP